MSNLLSNNQNWKGLLDGIKHQREEYPHSKGEKERTGRMIEKQQRKEKRWGWGNGGGARKWELKSNDHPYWGFWHASQSQLLP